MPAFHPNAGVTSTRMIRKKPVSVKRENEAEKFLDQYLKKRYGGIKDKPIATDLEGKEEAMTPAVL